MKKNLGAEIARVAYGLYERRGKMSGYEMDDWLRAEKIVMERYAGEIEKEARSIKTAQKTKQTPGKKKK